MRKALKWLRSLTPHGWIVSAVGLLLACGLVYVIVQRVFFQPQQLAEAKGTILVAEEQGKAEGRIVDNTMAAVREREVFREHVTTVVREGNNAIDQEWTGESVGEGVDAAGAAALCGLHDSLCRARPAEAVQPVR